VPESQRAHQVIILSFSQNDKFVGYDKSSTTATDGEGGVGRGGKGGIKAGRWVIGREGDWEVGLYIHGTITRSCTITTPLLCHGHQNMSAVRLEKEGVHPVH
jgi:hypothetical protein